MSGREKKVKKKNHCKIQFKNIAILDSFRDFQKKTYALKKYLKIDFSEITIYILKIFNTQLATLVFHFVYF